MSEENLEFIGPLAEKTCTKCSRSLRLREFYNQRAGRYSVASMCKLCASDYTKARCAAGLDRRDPEQMKRRSAYMRQHRANDLANRMLISARHSAKHKRMAGKGFNIDISDIVIPNICPVLGISLVNSSGTYVKTGATPSLDRFDSKKGYVKGNVNVISWRANDIKGHASLEELKAVRSWMEKVAA